MLNHSNQKKKKNYYYNVNFFVCVIFSILVDHYFVIDWNNCLFLNAVTQLLTSYYNSNDFFFKSLRSQGANVLRMEMVQSQIWPFFFCTMIFYFTFYLAQGFLVIFYGAAFSLNFVFPPIMTGLAFFTDLLVLNDCNLMIFP